MRKIRNLDGFKPYQEGDRLIAPGADTRVVSFELNPVGPCVVAMYRGEGKKVERTLVGVVDQLETLEITVVGDVWFQLEPSGEVWVRHKWQKVSNPNPGEDQTFTRMEKMGLYQDELGIALHRQAVLQRIQQGRELYERDAYQRQLERRLGELTTQIEALQAPKEQEEHEAPAE